MIVRYRGTCYPPQLTTDSQRVIQNILEAYLSNSDNRLEFYLLIVSILSQILDLQTLARTL